MSLNFLLEIGTEEIPDGMVEGALNQMKRWDHLFGAQLFVDATPRRLVIESVGFPERTPDTEQLIKGPPISSGDQAAGGFAKKQGVDPSALRKTGNYYEIVKHIPGRRMRDILAETLPGLILSIQWPKTMYWTAKNGPRFVRPIRWIVALLGPEVIPFEIAGVRSGNITRGHRQLGSQKIAVTCENYWAELEKNYVLKAEERAVGLGDQLVAFEILPESQPIFGRLVNLTEYPTCVKGEFDPQFLSLPTEVLKTVMIHHQKYFWLQDAKGRLRPSFVAVANTNGDPEGLIKRGNERVLRARFNDARFFWNVDQQKTLADRVDDLAKVTFQAKLGSYKEKTDRVVALAKELGGGPEVQRAALLSKCDLTTEMVKEFTDLQGVVGGLYAKAQGEPEPVWRAIYEHYKPLSMEDSIPSTREGQIVALADKLDTLRECFKIGMMPTGSKDPFALRRAAQGVVKLLAEAKLEYTLDQLAHGELRAFLQERIQYYFREVRGFKYDEVNAVLASGCGTLADVEARLTAVAAVRPTENFEPLAASFKRIRNILNQADGFKPLAVVDPTLFEAQGAIGPEKDLHEALRAVCAATQGASYQARLEGAATLRNSVDVLFNNIMVNAPDPKVRANRLTLLHQLLTEFSTIADFSEIVTSGDQK